MATEVPPQGSPLSGQVLFYVNPEPLDLKRHGKLGMKRTDRPFAYAAKQHYIPLHVGEFGPAAVNYPIIFAGDSYAPLAVMGLNDGDNLYISPDGVYRAGAYVPSFIRRYPFVAARDEQAERMVVCIDRAYAMWTEKDADVMLFEGGEPTEFTKGCIEFCSQFDTDRMRTESFTQLLKDLELFETRQTVYTPRLEDGTTGPEQLVAEYFAVSETKLNQLPADKLQELRDNGALMQIYAHLISLFGWDRLIMETLARQPAAPVAANA